MNDLSRRRLLQSAGVLTGAALIGSVAGRHALAADDTIGFLPAIDLARKIKSKEIAYL